MTMANVLVINKELKRKNIIFVSQDKPIENLCKNKFNAEEIWKASDIYPSVRYSKHPHIRTHGLRTPG